MFVSDSFLKNVSYTVAANIVSLLVSVATVFILPKFMTIKDYGIWQLYLFYFSYLGFFHFGWIDGIYLRYGGKYFDELPKGRFTGQFLAFISFEIFMAVSVFLVFRCFVSQDYMTELLIALCLVLVFVMVYSFASFILQITGKIKEYSVLLLTERVVFLLLTVGVVWLGYDDYRTMISISVFCKAGLAVVGVYLLRGLYSVELESVKEMLVEVRENISAGSKLMMANIAGMAVLGIVRFGISQGWSIEIFAKMSLALSFSNFVMLFINAVSVVFFPMLKRMNITDAERIYSKISWGLALGLPIVLVGYYPLRYFMTMWLPKYQESFLYMGILFPIFLYESRLGLLTNTYLKGFRQEYAMLKINFVVCALAVICAFVGVEILHSLNFMLFSILGIFAVRCVLAEWVLKSVLSSVDMVPIEVIIGLTVVFTGINLLGYSDVYSALMLIAILSVVYFVNRDKLTGVIGGKYNE